jgi:hypothetical protein
MNGSRKVLLVIAALAMTAYFLPATRDQFCWCWTQSCNHSDSYLQYLSDWPNGRHAVQAGVLYEQRLRAESKKAEILKAYQMVSMSSPANAESEAAYRRQRDMRRDNFFWKQATTVNTPASYRNYLEQYPQGSHAGEARLKIKALGAPAAGTNATVQ